MIRMLCTAVKFKRIYLLSTASKPLYHTLSIQRKQKIQQMSAHLSNYLKKDAGNVTPQQALEHGKFIANNILLNRHSIQKEYLPPVVDYYYTLKGVCLDSASLKQLLQFCQIHHSFISYNIVDQFDIQSRLSLFRKVVRALAKDQKTLPLSVWFSAYQKVCLLGVNAFPQFQYICGKIDRKLNKQQNYLRDDQYYDLSMQFYKAASKRLMFGGSQRKIILFLLKVNAQIINKLDKERSVKLVIAIANLKLIENHKYQYSKIVHYIYDCVEKNFSNMEFELLIDFFQVKGPYDILFSKLALMIHQKLVGLMDEALMSINNNYTDFQIFIFFEKLSDEFNLNNLDKKMPCFFQILTNAINSSKDNPEMRTAILYGLIKMSRNNFFTKNCQQTIPYLERTIPLLNLYNSKTSVKLVYQFSKAKVKIDKEVFQNLKIQTFSEYLYMVKIATSIKIQQIIHQDPQFCKQSEQFFHQKLSACLKNEQTFIEFMKELNDQNVLFEFHQYYGKQYFKSFPKPKNEISKYNTSLYYYLIVCEPKCILNKVEFPEIHNNFSSALQKYLIERHRMKSTDNKRFSDSFLKLCIHALQNQQTYEQNNKKLILNVLEVIVVYAVEFQKNFLYHNKSYHYYSFWTLVHTVFTHLKQIIKMVKSRPVEICLRQIVFVSKFNNFSNEIEYRKFISQWMCNIDAFFYESSLSRMLLFELYRLNIFDENLHVKSWLKIRNTALGHDVRIFVADSLLLHKITQKCQLNYGQSYYNLTPLFMKVNQNKDGKYNSVIQKLLKSNISLRFLELYIVYFDLDKTPFNMNVFKTLITKMTEQVTIFRGFNIIGILKSIVKNHKKMEATETCRMLPINICDYLNNKIAHYSLQTHAQVISLCVLLNYKNQQYYKNLLNWSLSGFILKRLVDHAFKTLIFANYQFSVDQIKKYSTINHRRGIQYGINNFLLMEPLIDAQNRSEILKTMIYKVESCYVDVIVAKYLLNYYKEQLKYCQIYHTQIDYHELMLLKANEQAQTFITKIEDQCNFKFSEIKVDTSNVVYLFKRNCLFFTSENNILSPLKIQFLKRIIACYFKIEGKNIIYSTLDFEENTLRAQIHKIIGNSEQIDQQNIIDHLSLQNKRKGLFQKTTKKIENVSQELNNVNSTHLSVQETNKEFNEKIDSKIEIQPSNKHNQNRKQALINRKTKNEANQLNKNAAEPKGLFSHLKKDSEPSINQASLQNNSKTEVKPLKAKQLKKDNRETKQGQALFKNSKKNSKVSEVSKGQPLFHRASPQLKQSKTKIFQSKNHQQIKE